MNTLISFIKDSNKSFFSGGLLYKTWLTLLTLIIFIGAIFYYYQIEDGLSITGMNDHISWGLYISNFTFLVGLAAAAVMLVLPAYILKDTDFKASVLIGEGVAVAALIMCLLFVVVDMGRPDRLWHMLVSFNFPDSILTWDVIVLNGYLLLNLSIPFYLMYSKYKGVEPDPKKYVPFVLMSVFWAIGIHTVTAFLYAGLKARPFWNTSILGIRFLASAFCAGPAFIILVLALVRRYTDYKIQNVTFNKLGFIITVAAQINMFLLFSELFKEFYSDDMHSISASYLFFGYHGHNALVPWIWTSFGLNLIATVGLSILGYLRTHDPSNPRRKKRFYIFCIMAFIGIWIEKGMGLIVPGFIPNPIGEIVEYLPSFAEVMISIGIWAVGLLVMTALIKVAIPIELDEVKFHKS